MNVGTDAEVVQILKDSRWNSGIKVDKHNLFYDGPEANCIELKFLTGPEGPHIFRRRRQG